MYLGKLEMDATSLLTRFAWRWYGLATFGHGFTRQVVEESFGGWFIRIQMAQRFSPSMVWLPEWHPEEGLRMHFMMAGIGCALRDHVTSWSLPPRAFSLVKLVPYFDPPDGDWYKKRSLPVGIFCAGPPLGKSRHSLCAR